MRVPAPAASTAASHEAATAPVSASMRPPPANAVAPPPDMPPPDELDDLLDDYIERDRGSAELVADGFDREVVERVLRMVDHAEYKRRQYPPGPKISFKAFGKDRRLPITNRYPG